MKQFSLFSILVCLPIYVEVVAQVMAKTTTSLTYCRRSLHYDHHILPFVDVGQKTSMTILEDDASSCSVSPCEYA